MPRRGGRERTPNQARRELAEFQANYPELAKARRDGVGLGLVAKIAHGKVVENVPAGLLCVHGVPWTICTQCSKPRSTP